jgi:hypothetical protein
VSGTGHTRFAETLRDFVREGAGRAANVFQGEVIDANPLKVRMHHRAIALTDDDFDLTAWVRHYDVEYGIEKGDTVTLFVEQGEFVIFDVLPEAVPLTNDAASVAKKRRQLEKRLDKIESRLDAHADRLDALEEA